MNHKPSRPALVAAFFILLFACTNSPKPTPVSALPDLDGKPGDPKTLAGSPLTTTFNGIIRMGDELRTFTDCATGKTYWIEDKTGNLVKKASAANDPVHFDGEPSFGTLSGKLLGKSKVGHAATCDDVLSVEKIDSISGIGAENLCLPFNFICSGTEPFWTCTISEGLQGIVLQDIASGKAHVFPWAEPEKQKNGSFLCESESAAGERIRIMVKPEKATDGMSDRTYDYSVIVAIGKAKWKGVAIKG